MTAGIVIILVVGIFVTASRNYKKELFASLEKKGNELKVFYPAALRIITIFKKLGICIFDTARKKKIESLNTVLDRADTELMYNVRRISLVLFIILMSCAVSILYYAARDDGGLSKYQLTRPGYGEAAKEVSMLANGQELSVEVGAVEYTLDEVYDNFEATYEYLLEIMPNDNEGLDAVDSNINMPTYIDNYAISISWLTSNTDLIDIYGTVCNEDFTDGESKEVILTAVMNYLDYTCEYEIFVTVVARQLNDVERFIQKLRLLIKERELLERNSQVLKLPEAIEGEEISYSPGETDYSYLIVILGIAAAAAVFIGMDKDLDGKLNDRNRQMLLDYSEIVSKLNILTGAGMSTFRAWEKIVGDYEKKVTADGRKNYAYEEMKITYNSILSGVSEGSAYSEFGKRCNIHEYLKLGALLEQNVRKGSKGLSKMLEEEAALAFEQRKNLAKRLGEEAGTKLLIPMIIMLSIVMVIVMIPAFTSF